LPYAAANLGLAEDIGFESINGEVYSTCWTPFQLSAARLSEEDVVSDVLHKPTLYPNPVSGSYASLSVYSDADETLGITILDMHGRIALNKTVQAYSGENQIELSLDALPAGVYTIALECKSQENRFIRFVKQ
jgi:hypothetical protein